LCGGNVQGWAEQGVLLLNIILTTEDVLNAHRRIGWEEVQKRVMVCLLELNIPLVFMLFGIEARQFFDTIKSHVKKLT
jgi:uracil-DNA glycosylase